MLNHAMIMETFCRIRLIFISFLCGIGIVCLNVGSSPASESEIVSMTDASQEGLTVFPIVEGWKISEKIKTFSPETLYDYIDGAAELFLSYDFQKLQVAEYSTKGGASVVIELYRHRTPRDAFGIYSQERPSGGSYLNVGSQGYFDGTILNFVSGNHYVKISCYEVEAKVQDVLMAFAQKSAQKLGSRASLPAILNCFPAQGKKQNSEQFVAKNFLGYEFLHSGFKADYEDSKASFTLFIIEGTDMEDCRKMITRYLEKLKSSQPELQEGDYKVSDPYHGEIQFIWKGKYIWGALNLRDPVARSHYLRLIGENLNKRS